MARRIAVLLRHGKYEQPEGVPSAHLPHPLTVEGIRQAEQAGEFLRRYANEQSLRVDSGIDSSRMLRAWQTAERVRSALDDDGVRRDICETEALAERSVGCLANLTVDEIEAVAARDPRVRSLPSGWKTQAEFCLPFQGAESLLDAGARVARHVETALAAISAEADTLKIFVGHGGAFRHAAVHLGVITLAQAPHLSMYHCRPVFIERLASGMWQHVGGDWKKRDSYSRHFD